MKFEDALEKVFDRDEKKHGTVFAERNTLNGIDEVKIAAKVWNIIAIALAEKGLDDFIIISNGAITSIPLKEEKTEKEPDAEKNKKSKSPESETATDETVNVKEKPEKGKKSAESDK
jgi:hypothetical protein